MHGGTGGRRRYPPVSTVQAVETVLAVLTLSVLGGRVADWPLPGWALVLAPTILAVTVLGHRLPQLWRVVRGSTDATSANVVARAALEASLAAGYLLVLVVLFVGVFGTIGAATSGAFDAAGSGIGFVVGSAVVVGALAFLLLLVVGGRLVVAGIRAVGR